MVCCHLIHYSFLNPLHLRSMLSKSMRCTKHCNACSRHLSIERAHFFCTTTPDHMLHNECFKSWMSWTVKFNLIRHIHLTSRQMTTTSSSISTTFCRKMLPQPAGCRKCFPRVHRILRCGFLCYRNKKLVSHKINVLILIVPILINKDVFEPSYNDLKFTNVIMFAPT